MTDEEIEEYETEFAGHTITGLYEEINQLRIENEKQEAQIEKMKCCGNCLNRIDGQESADGCKVNWDCEKYINWRFEK